MEGLRALCFQLEEMLMGPHDRLSQFKGNFKIKIRRLLGRCCVIVYFCKAVVQRRQHVSPVHSNYKILLTNSFHLC